MAFIQWKSEYSVGVQVIDEQHQHLIEIINDLDDRVKSTIGGIDIMEFFNEVINYGEYLFQTEETFFSRYEYAQRQEHLLAHRGYKDTLTNLLAAEGDSRTKAEKLLSFLSRWWIEHISGMDQTLRDLSQQAA